MRLIAIILMWSVSVGYCQTLEQVQRRIDSLNFSKADFQNSISLIDKEIQKQNNLLQTLRGLESEKAVTITANKGMNLLDDRSITSGKVISKVAIGSPIKLISFDGDYYYAESGNVTGYIYYPYLNDIKGLDDFKNYWKKKSSQIRSLEKVDQSQKDYNERLKSLTEKYGFDNAYLIANKKLKIGMTEAMVRESIGSPNSKNVSHYASGTHEQWVYKDRYVYLENGILTSWQEDR